MILPLLAPHSTALLDTKLGCCFGGLLDLATQSMPHGQSLRYLVEDTCEVKTCSKFSLPEPLLEEQSPLSISSHAASWAV